MNRRVSKAINVSLRVIADLSQGLYRSPADALKELVSNAYDADSEVVEINFARDFSSLTIRDWGKGMTIDEFIEVMETIGGTTKRSLNEPDITSSGRKIVGRIGIGLLGASQMATSLEIESTVKGLRKGFRAQIEFDQFVSEEARKIKITDLWEKDKDIEIGRYYYTEIRGVDEKKHLTSLKLNNLKRTIVEKLRAKSEKDGEQRMLGTLLHSTRELIEWMGNNYITKTGLHEYDRIFFELCTLCPVPYLSKPLRIYNMVDLKGPVKRSSSTQVFTGFTDSVNHVTHLKLTVDGIQCFKPVLMPSKSEKNYPLFFNLLFMNGLNDKEILYTDYDQEGKLATKRLRVRGYFYFQRPKVWPPELQGLLIRVRHVAVGQYDSTFMTYRKHEGFKFSQLTGEILVDELDEALNIDRSSFRETEPPFVAFRDAIHNYLSEVVFPGIKLYASLERKDRRYKQSFHERKILQRQFKDIDRKKRKIIFKHDQSKLVERSGSDISIALSILGKKQRFSTEFYRVVSFLEAYLSHKLHREDRDELYENLCDWLEEFE